MTVARVVIVAAASLALGAASKPAAPARPPPASDDVPPFVHARGDGGEPLTLAISGLRTGYAKVFAGARVLSLCWLGGKSPFEVVVTAPGGEPILHEANLDGNELIEASRSVILKRGVYRIVLSDAAGEQVQGSFQAAAPGEIGDSPADVEPSDQAAVSNAMSLVSSSPALSYEAFLRLAPTAGGPDTASGKALAQLCHLTD